MWQDRQSNTQSGAMHVVEREYKVIPASQEPMDIQWAQPVKKRFGEQFGRNLAVAAALMLCAAALRQGAIPPLKESTDAILTAVTDRSLLEDGTLGKLSFVSSLFPEATLVFGQQDMLETPVSGDIVHVWSEAEPYMTWATQSEQVCAAEGGEVIGVYHGDGDERLVQVMGDQGLTCLYGNLEQVVVRTGDRVESGDPLGRCMPGKGCVLEVRKNGISVDPALFLP